MADLNLPREPSTAGTTGNGSATVAHVRRLAAIATFTNCTRWIRCWTISLIRPRTACSRRWPGTFSKRLNYSEPTRSDPPEQFRSPSRSVLGPVRTTALGMVRLVMGNVDGSLRLDYVAAVIRSRDDDGVVPTERIVTEPLGTETDSPPVIDRDAIVEGVTVSQPVLRL